MVVDVSSSEARMADWCNAVCASVKYTQTNTLRLFAGHTSWISCLKLSPANQTDSETGWTPAGKLAQPSRVS